MGAWEGENTVLIVDDNQRVLAALARMVSRMRFSPAAYNSLDRALNVVASSTTAPAAAIIDVYLERGRQGFELGDQIQQQFGRSVPILMITGYRSGAGEHQQMYPILEKPISSAERLSGTSGGDLLTATIAGGPSRCGGCVYD